jgi:hypothetical protein
MTAITLAMAGFQVRDRGLSGYRKNRAAGDMPILHRA